MRLARGGPFLPLLAALAASGCASQDQARMRPIPVNIPSWVEGPPPTTGVTAKPRLDHVVTLGAGDQESPVFDRDTAPTAAQRAAQCPTCSSTSATRPLPRSSYPTYYGGYGYGWYGGYGGWRGHPAAPATNGTPHGGGDWPAIPDHGPSAIPPAHSSRPWP